MVEVTEAPDDSNSDKMIVPVAPQSHAAPSREDLRTCWICFDSEEGEPEDDWVQPCVCRGATKWVHQDCIKRWIDEKLKDNPHAVPECPQCKTKYIIIYPESGILLQALDKLEAIERITSPYMIAVLLGASMYWCILSFGALTVMEVVGQEQAMRSMERGDPLVIAIGLPFIPVLMAAGRLIPWEDTLLDLMRSVSEKVRALRAILPQGPSHGREDIENQQNFDPIQVTRAICGVVVLPTMATWFGNMWFSSTKSNIQRALLGGAAYILMKGFIKMYYKQKRFMRREKRKIANYDPDMSEETDSDDGKDISECD